MPCAAKRGFALDLVKMAARVGGQPRLLVQGELLAVPGVLLLVLQSRCPVHRACFHSFLCHLG